MEDVTFQTAKGYFMYRVGAVVLHNDQVLVIKNSNFPFYYTVGGRVKVGETSEEAVLREVLEETGIPMAIDRLAFIHENLYTDDFRGNKNAQMHQIALYYLMQTPDNLADIQCKSLGDDGGRESLHWLSIKDLPNYELYPEFFKSASTFVHLKNTSTVGHYITKKGSIVK